MAFMVFSPDVQDDRNSADSDDNNLNNFFNSNSFFPITLSSDKT